MVLKRKDLKYLGKTEIKYFDELKRLVRELVQNVNQQCKLFDEMVKIYKGTNKAEKLNSTSFGK